MSSHTAPVTIKNAQRLLDIARRFETPEEQPEAAPTPVSKSDLISEINMPQNVHLNTGSDITIDVLPDARLIFRALTYHIIRLYPTFDIRPHPMVTPVSLMAYCLFCIYGFSLVCDSSARRLKSFYCNIFLREPNGADLQQSLLNMYVPEFIIDFIIGLSPTADPRKTGTEYVFTLAAYVSTTDIFRLPSPAMFLHAHHLLANTRTNIDPTVLMNKWYNTTFITMNSATTPIQYKIANFFGTNYTDGTTSSTHFNWLNECITTLFNPVVGRSLAARPTFRPHPVTFPSFPSTDFNPYTFYLASDAPNIFQTTRFIDEISSFFKSCNLASVQLGSIFAKTSGLALLTHALSEPALPTWHVLTVKSSDSDVPDFKDDTDYATTIKFLGDQSYTTRTQLKYPTDDTVITKLLYLVSKGKHDDSKSPETFVTFDPRIHTHPRVRFFDPYDYSPSKLVYSVINGLIIETFEIDGFTVPNVNLRSSLDEDNSQFLQSAVRSGLIRPATSTLPTFVIKRTVTRSDKQKVSLSMFNFSRTRLPQFDQDVSDHTLPASLPGFRSTPHVRATELSSNHYSYKAVRDHTLPRTIHAWSSYRYVSRQAASINADIFFLLSFRTNYGTNVTLSESKHPSLLIPN